MRKVYCDLCGNEIKRRESLLESRGIPVNEKIAIEVSVRTRGDGELCNKCRNNIINRGEEIVNKIKEELENGKKDEKES